MKKISLFALTMLFAVGLFPVTGRAENEKTADIYIIAGQSNAVGSSITHPGTASPNVPNVLYYGAVDRSPEQSGYQNHGLEPVRNGLGAENEKSGFEVGMAEVLNGLDRYQKGEATAVIIKYAAGGTSIKSNESLGSWYPPTLLRRDFPDADYTKDGMNYRDLEGYQYRMLLEEVAGGIKALRENGYTKFCISGVFWMQGETDTSRVSAYEEALPVLISDLRRDLGEIVGQDLQKMPFYIGEISRTFHSASDYLCVQSNEALIEAQNRIAASVPYTYVAKLADYAINELQNDGSNRVVGSDNWHWSYSDIRQIGKDFANLYLETGCHFAPGQLLDSHAELSVEAESSCRVQFTGKNLGNYGNTTEKITFDVYCDAAETIADIDVENGTLRQVETVYEDQEISGSTLVLPPVRQYEITDITGQVKLTVKSEESPEYQVNVVCKDETWGRTPNASYIKPAYENCRYILKLTPKRDGAVKYLLINGTKIKGGTDVFTFDNLTDYAQENEINIEIVYDSAGNVQKYLNTNFALLNGIVAGVGGVLLLTAGLVTILLVKKKKRANSKESI